MKKEKLDYFCNCIEDGFLKIAFKTTGLELMRCDSMEPVGDKYYLMVIGVVGINTGQIMVEMNEGLVNRIIESMNGGLAENDEEMFFSLAEFINMVGGNGINSINNAFSFFDLRLTPPIIFAGKNLENTIMKTKSVSRFYKAEYEQAKIEIGFEGV